MLAITLAGLFTLLFIAFFRQNASKLGLVDRPGGRKVHLNATPVIGGIAIFLGSSLALLLSGHHDSETLTMLTICLGLVTLGAVDDALDLSAAKRLLAHLVAGLVMVSFCGERISGLNELLPFNAQMLTLISIPLTVLAVAAVVNAFNLSDGVDGLAGCMALGLLVFLGLVANSVRDHRAALFCFVMASALVLFLAFNFRFPWRKQAEIFLGDAGSTFIGFFLVWAAIRISNNGGFNAIVILWLFAVPVTDAVSVMVKRRLASRPIFLGGRDHLHHLLLARGFSDARVAIFISAGSTFIGVAGFTLDKMGLGQGPMLILALTIMASQLALSLRMKSAETVQIRPKLAA